MRFHHVGLEVTNLEKSMAFYQQLLNLEIETRFSFMNEDIVFLGSKDYRLELIETQEDVRTVHICFEVPNLHEVMNQFHRTQKLEGPYELENGWQTVFYEGPNREIIEFIQIGNTL
ncbi:VOC family protein [Sporosarcina sp. ITBMC105]